MRSFLLASFCLLINFCEAQKLNRDSLRLVAPLNGNCTPVKNQFMSATCWSFSSNSFLESELMKMGKGENDLSEMFVARYSMFRKIKRHLQLKGQNFFTPGGQFHDAAWVMKNYGMVPEEVYSGKGRGETRHDHADMDTLLNYFVKACVANGISELSQQQHVFIDSVLDLYYGKLPVQFYYKGKSYNPLTYLKEYLSLDPDDFIEITSYTHHPFYKPFILEDKYNWTSDAYYNVTLSDFSKITDHALANGYTVGWDGDVDDPDFDYFKGLAYLPGTIKDFQTERQKAFETQSTLLDHMMHIVGVVKDRFGWKWYYIKNSWGENSNLLKGFLYMRDDYFKMRTVAIIVNKKAIPPDIRKKLGI